MKEVTKEDVSACRIKYGYGLNLAKRWVEHHNAEEAIRAATTVDDLKPILLFLLNRE